MSKSQIAKDLKELGIDFDTSSTKSELQDLLSEATGFSLEDESLGSVETLSLDKDVEVKEEKKVEYNSGLNFYLEQQKKKAVK
jgi:hypothetical protein